MINALTIFLVFQLVGEVIARGLTLPLPGPVIGLALLFVCLSLRPSLSPPLTQTAEALHSHMSLLFVPAGVGVSLYYPQLAREWLGILAALVISTLVGLAVTAWVLKLLVEVPENE
jgi:holin-like protein